MSHNFDIDSIVANKDVFNDFVYTSLEDAVEQIKIRRENDTLRSIVDEIIGIEKPEPLREDFKVVLFRQLFSPNHEFLRFRSIVEASGLVPVFWEYHDDKFTSNNPIKKSWGKIPINKGVGKDGSVRLEYNNIIDFNTSTGKKIKEVKNNWGQSLIDFHHELLENVHPGSKNYLYDASTWFALNSSSAKDYYKSYMALFVRDAILFENFVLKDDELEFTKNVFLPAFIEIYQRTGVKPLIVALEPTEIENDIFWLSYPQAVSEYIDRKKLL